MSRCCKYNARMLKEPVTFETLTRVTDGSGGSTETWAAISGAPEMAGISAVSGGERYASDRVEATVRLKVVCRYFSGLSESDRVVFRERAHNIRFIDNVDLEDRWLEIRVDGGVAT